METAAMKATTGLPLSSVPFQARTITSPAMKNSSVGSSVKRIVASR
jgi:hypothetical protein